MSERASATRSLALLEIVCWFSRPVGGHFNSFTHQAPCLRSVKYTGFKPPFHVHARLDALSCYVSGEE
jgi:hypothetical protein